MSKPKTPERIYLFETGDGILWCEDPDPAPDMNAEDAVEYVRVDATKTAQQDAPTDAEIDIDDVRQYLDSWGCLAHPGVKALVDSYAPAQDAAHPRTAKPCAHLFEARPVMPGSAYSPYEGVCVKCGFRPTIAYYVQQDGGDAEDEWLEELQHIAIQYGCLRYDTAIAEQRCGDHENIEAKAEEKLAELLRHARAKRAAAQDKAA